MDATTESALDQNAAQQTAAEKREMLGRLLSRLAHEIRNPLSSLDVHFQLLDEDLEALAPELRARFSPRLEIIQGELHRLKRISENFLRLAGPSTVDLEAIDLPPLINHVCELLRPEAAARNIQILSSFPNPPLPPVVADPVRFTQALLNLFINGLQAINRDGMLQIRTGVNTTHLFVTVQDSGPGIPPERLAAIFDPYFTTKSEGSGLGLWIAQQIIIAHGGTISVQNVAEGGASFTVLLPLTNHPDSPTPAAATRDTASIDAR